MKVALTESSWGGIGKDQIEGAICQAEALGIFAREGLDYAARWTAPSSGWKIEDAFKLFTKYDGQNSVTGDSVSAITSDIDTVGSYAFHDLERGKLCILLTNKKESMIWINVTTEHVGSFTSIAAFGFDSTTGLHQYNSDSTVWYVNENEVAIQLQGMSAVMIVGSTESQNSQSNSGMKEWMSTLWIVCALCCVLEKV